MYKELSKLFYADASSNREANLQQEYERRLRADSTFRLGFVGSAGELFIAVPRSLSLLVEEVLKNERSIDRMLSTMPGTARAAVLRGLVLDEVVSTNAIEEISSTRKQVQDSLSAVEDTGNRTRFRELALLYLAILDGTATPPGSLSDIRRIYDHVTYGEIPKEHAPDGKLFRAKGVQVIQAGSKVIHTGLEPEERIAQALERMLSIAYSGEIPVLYGSIAAHYLFEHAHPFYDGNGRTGRFLLSLMLQQVLSAATALSVSKAICKNRSAYYRAFKTAEKPLNKGELTFFIRDMLQIIRNGQADLQKSLSWCHVVLDSLDQVCDEMTNVEGLKSQEARVVRMLFQHEAFGLVRDAPLQYVASDLGLKEQMARKHLLSLQQKGIVERVNKRNPVSFALTQEFKDRHNVDVILRFGEDRD